MKTFILTYYYALKDYKFHTLAAFYLLLCLIGLAKFEKHTILSLGLIVPTILLAYKNLNQNAVLLILIICIFSYSVHKKEPTKENFVPISRDQTYTIEVCERFPSVEGKIAQESKCQGLIKLNENLFLVKSSKICRFEPGDIIKTELSPKKNKSNYNIGVFNYSLWLSNQGIRGQVNIDNAEKIGSNNGLATNIKKLRNALIIYFRDEFTPHGALVNGLLWGYRADLQKEKKEAFRKSGSSHILAVSGMHLAILILFINTLLKQFIFNIKARHILIALLLWLYFPLSGASVSVFRAIFYYSIFVYSLLRNVHFSPVNALFITFSIQLLLEPNSLGEAGTLLSYSASFFLIVAYSQHKKNLHNSLFQISLKRLKIIFGAGVIASLATFPIVLHFFKEWYFIGIVAGVFLGLLAFLVMLCSILGGIFSLIDIQIVRDAAKLFSWIMENSVIWVAEVFGSSISPFVFSTPMFVVWYILLIIVLNKKINWSSNYFFRTSSIIILIFIFAQGFKSKHWEISFLDVGQGDAVLINRSGSSRGILYDTGPGNPNYSRAKDAIVPYLKHKNIDTLEALIISHGDQDHIGGALWLMKNFPIKRLIINKTTWNSSKKSVMDLRNYIENNDVTFLLSKAGFQYKWDDMIIKDISAPPKGKDLNYNSTVLSVRIGKQKILLTGDIDSNAEKNLSESAHYDLLKAGHHGSGSSSGKEFIRRSSPKMVIISAGRKNRYGHPNKRVINLLDSLKIPYLNTARDGGINCLIKSKIECSSFRDNSNIEEIGI